MHTTLISVIGKPRPGKYEKSKYRLDGEVFETDFFFLPLLRHYRPQQFYLLGTKDSIWQAVEEARKQHSFTYEPVVVPFGVTPEEIWQIFEMIVKLPLTNTRLIIDITHGFRAIPFAVFLAAVYFQAVREDVKIADILYGNHEARDPNSGIAPVVHLQSYLDMHQWIRAARRFVQYGDGDLILEKLSQYPLSEEAKKVLETFRDFLGNLQLNFVTQIGPSAERLANGFSEPVAREILNIAPYALLHPVIEERLGMFLQEDPEWLRQWRIADWFYRNRQYSKALVVLREMLITFTGELIGLRIFALYDREKKISFLHTYMVYFDKPGELKGKLTPLQIEEIQQPFQSIRVVLGKAIFDDWRKIIGEVQEARNHVGHALIRKGKGATYIEPTREIERIERWVDKSHSLLTRIWGLPDEKRKTVVKNLKEVLKISLGKKIRCFVIVNEGIHPVVEDLKKQYGQNIRYEVVTRGNVELKNEKDIALRVKEIIEKNLGAEFIVVPSGLPYIITTVYNTIVQITSRHPVYLQLNRETGKYEEKMLDPRKLLF